MSNRHDKSRKKNMNKNKASISKKSSYIEIGDYWEEHDVTKVWDKTKNVEFDVQIESEANENSEHVPKYNL